MRSTTASRSLNPAGKGVQEALLKGERASADKASADKASADKASVCAASLV